MEAKNNKVVRLTYHSQTPHGSKQARAGAASVWEGGSNAPDRLRAHTLESPATVGKPCGVTSWLMAITSLFSKIVFCTGFRYALQCFGVIGGLPGLGDGRGDGCGEARHVQVWFRGGSGILTLQETSVTPLHVNVPRQPTAHIDPFGKHPKVFPSTHAAFDSCLVHEQACGGTAAVVASAATVQFMIGVVNRSGEARMAHIENSVMDSSSVTFGGPNVGSNPDAGPVPVCSIYARSRDSPRYKNGVSSANGPKLCIIACMRRINLCR